jgi:hypothetical protein
MIRCPFSSLQDLNARMQFTSMMRNSSACTCCSFGQTLAFSINSKYFYLSPLKGFPNSSTAIVLPVIYGDFDPTIVLHWLTHTHNTRVLGVDTVIVYSQNSTETFDRNGRLKMFYSSFPNSSIVIVDIPQIDGLNTHYYGQQYVINDAFLRAVGAVEFLGSFDVDEFLEIPPGQNITEYLRQKLCRKVGSVCTEPHQQHWASGHSW